MNTTASFSSEHSWSRRCSTETVFSIQGKETDVVRDTSDTSSLWSDDERDAEYEPVTEPEDEAPVNCDSSGESDNEIIATSVIEVSIRDDGDLEFADSEQTESNGSDSEIDWHDYWKCAQCNAANNNPLYRYCEKCYKVRKNFFPPRPKRKPKHAASERECRQMRAYLATDRTDETLPRLQEAPATEEAVAPLNRALKNLSQDSAYESLSPSSHSSQELGPIPSPTTRKRRSESVDMNNKKIRLETGSESEADDDKVQPLVKTNSDPLLTLADNQNVSQKQTIGETRQDGDNVCIVCLSQPKSGVFVHGRIAHICCCYNCAVKVWTKAKRCPVCNCKVSNVLKAVVM